MAFFRENHREKGNFTQVSNALVLDTRISSKAKMYLVLMLSRPDTWKFSVDGLLRFIKEGKSALKSGLDELTEFGYLKKKKRHINGRWDWEYTIIENPVDDPDAKQQSNSKEEKPQNDKPKEEKPSVKNNKQKNNRQKNGALNFNEQKTKSHSNTVSSNTDFSNTVFRESEEPANSENQRFGRYKNISLTPDEYKSLTKRYGKYQTDRSIEVASEYGHMNGRRYSYARMDVWIRQDTEKAGIYGENNYEKPQSHKSHSRFDISDYERICVNNY
ncbi:MAG: hypothetical protein K2J08_12670, partial [Ruminococcus sp.]|nr:hypothetical protein [Ruminococcus sp.]